MTYHFHPRANNLHISLSSYAFRRRNLAPFFLPEYEAHFELKTVK